MINIRTKLVLFTFLFLAGTALLADSVAPGKGMEASVGMAMIILAINILLVGD